MTRKIISYAVVLLILSFVGSCTDDLTSIDMLDETENALSLADGDSFIANKTHATVGDVSDVVSYSSSSPEGIAFDRRGNMYVGRRQIEGGLNKSYIDRIAPDGTVRLFAELPSASPASFALLGLVTDRKGNVYACLASNDASTRGVYKISHRGEEVERLAGSARILMPNALTFDSRGNLYVTDSMVGKVWRYAMEKEHSEKEHSKNDHSGKKDKHSEEDNDDSDEDGIFTEWIQASSLETAPVPGAPFPLPGANGIAFFPPNLLYVANTAQNAIIRIRITPDGFPASPETIPAIPSSGYFLINPDGIALDVHGDIYTVLPPSTIVPPPFPPFMKVAPVVKIDHITGDITPITTDVSRFDTPLSLAFGTRGRDRKSLFVTNGDLFGDPTGPGFGVVKVYVGKPGYNGR